MIRTQIIIITLLSILGIELNGQSGPDLNNILNQLRPELLQPGTISTPGYEFGTSVSPDGEELFFNKRSFAYRRIVLVYCNWKDGLWSEPQTAPFSGEYPDMNPYHSKDGKRLYFTSNRPSSNERLKGFNFWYVDRLAKGWSEPKIVKGDINDEYDITYPTIHKDGMVHFHSSSRPDSKGADIYVSRLVNGSYNKPELVDELNTEVDDADPEMSLDGKYLFLTSRREGGLGDYDLYVFKKRTDGKWSNGINLGPKINSENSDADPILSPDGKTLYFSSNRAKQSEDDGARLSDYKQLIDSNNQIHNGFMNLYKVDISTLLDYLDKTAIE